MNKITIDSQNLIGMDHDYFIFNNYFIVHPPSMHVLQKKCKDHLVNDGSRTFRAVICHTDRELRIFIRSIITAMRKTVVKNIRRLASRQL